MTTGAIIISFPRKRGRPKSARIGKDTGTPELVMKRAHGLTSEALDLCLAREHISEKQHWCGIHLRWLYTLRYGVPSVRALDPSHFGGSEPKTDDPAWRAEREKEYNEAINELNKQGLSLPIMNLCIFNERPAFLNSATATKNHLPKIIEGFGVLESLWCKAKVRH